MGRCFPGIGRLGLSREWGVRIESLISPEGEHLLLRNPVDLVVGGGLGVGDTVTACDALLVLQQSFQFLWTAVRTVAHTSSGPGGGW
jgi:hypothetical protein